MACTSNISVAAQFIAPNISVAAQFIAPNISVAAQFIAPDISVAAQFIAPESQTEEFPFTMTVIYNFAVLFSIAAPFTVVIYLAGLLFIRPPRAVLIASLLGGLVMGLLNMLTDLAAYYAHWWHYTLKDLLLHVPVPFYITPILLYGSLVYLLIWQLWLGKTSRIARILLFGLPIFGILSEILSVQLGASYIAWDSILAIPMTVVMWPLMFYAGFFIFKRLAPSSLASQEKVSQ